MLIFFYWFVVQVFCQLVLCEDFFGLKMIFVGLVNFCKVLFDLVYLNVFQVMVVFLVLVVFFVMVIVLFLVVQVEKVICGKGFYCMLMIWFYVVVLVIVGMLWLFMFNFGFGMLVWLLCQMGINWNLFFNGDYVMMLVVVVLVWKQISYNFLFFVVGLQVILRLLFEVVVIDGVIWWYSFWIIVFLLLVLMMFFLLVVNMVYVLFDIFGIIYVVIGGGFG